MKVVRLNSWWSADMCGEGKEKQNIKDSIKKAMSMQNDYKWYGIYLYNIENIREKYEMTSQA